MRLLVDLRPLAQTTECSWEWKAGFPTEAEEAKFSGVVLGGIVSAPDAVSAYMRLACRDPAKSAECKSNRVAVAICIIIVNVQSSKRYLSLCFIRESERIDIAGRQLQR